MSQIINIGYNYDRAYMRGLFCEYSGTTLENVPGIPPQPFSQNVEVTRSGEIYNLYDGLGTLKELSTIRTLTITANIITLVASFVRWHLSINNREISIQEDPTLEQNPYVISGMNRNATYELFPEIELATPDPTRPDLVYGKAKIYQNGFWRDATAKIYNRGWKNAKIIINKGENK